MTADTCCCADAGWRLRFDPAVEGLAALEFPCDEEGHVDLDAFDDRQRHSYFCARMLRSLHHPPRVTRAADC